MTSRRTVSGALIASKRHWQAVVVLSLGILATAILTVSSAAGYSSDERRLISLQTRLSGSVLQTAQPEEQAILARIIGLTAASSNPVATFREATAAEVTPRGSFVSATAAIVEDGRVRILDHVGTAPLRSLDSAATTALFLQAARTSSLVTSRIVSSGVQRLAYLMSARGSDQQVFVVNMSQQLAVNRRVSVPPGSPDSNLNFALYFGPSTVGSALIETNATHLPLTGTTARTEVPFGNNVLTFVASPRDSLAGTWAEYLPWGILGLGILLSGAFAGITETLVRRRGRAESLYQQHRSASETLQQAILPKALPDIPSWEFAARYVPAMKGAEIGGDWYSVVEVDEHRFALVIGDVSGHDMAAAGVMAGLRYTIRTLAKVGFTPAEILDRAGSELDLISDDHFATVLVGQIDTRTHRLTLASAGHMPPLMVRDGRAEFLDVGSAVPLGVVGPRPQETTIDFPPGSTLIVYTDGLIEQRGQSLDTSLGRLHTAALSSAGRPEQLIVRLLDALANTDQEDDIAVLVVQPTAPRHREQVPVSPHSEPAGRTPTLTD